MTEKDLNSIISRSLTWAFKIPDQRGATGQLPFDGFGLYTSIPIYWEAKNLKAVKAFNFEDLQSHQIGNLLRIQELCSAALPLFLVGVAFTRMDKRLFIFKDMSYINKRKDERKSITKKEFERRQNFVPIQKGQVDFGRLLSLPKEWEYEHETV